MFDALLQEAAKASLWAGLSVALIYWTLKENRVREEAMRAESKQREDRLIAENKSREERLIADGKEREAMYAEREDRYLAIIQTLGEEVKDRLKSLEEAVQEQKGRF